MQNSHPDQIDNQKWIKDAMRRFISFLAVATLAIAALSQTTSDVAGQFATNTPISQDGEQSPLSPTTETGSGLGFATNTPSGPTLTPSTTPTATQTATATATASNTPTATFTPTNTPSPTPTPNGPFSYPDGVNPLTGQPYPSDEARARRNLIVKISNYPPLVRPQHGVNSADVVYEYEAEGGVTRFAAIYRSQSPERVGSIRSARLLDMQLVTMYRALLAYSGTSEPIQEMLLEPPFFEFQLLSPLIGNNCEQDGFCRDQSLRETGVPFEHTLFGEPAKFWDRATRQNTDRKSVV